MKDLSLKAIVPALRHFMKQVKPYVLVMFIVLFAGVYGFIVLQISTLSDPVVSDQDVSDKVKASPSLVIDSTSIKQLESLKDNSVNVQTFFEQSRSNPFQE